MYQLYNRKDKNKEKEAGNGPSLKKVVSIYFLDRMTGTKDDFAFLQQHPKNIRCSLQDYQP